MFERYTERARRVLFFARYEASQLGSISIETEHLLLGLIREGKGLTSRIFARSHLSLDNIRKEIEGRTVFREKVSTSVEIPFSADTKRVLQFAAEEAERLLHNYIGTEHLLLGILREERSVAATILMEKGMRLHQVREDIVQLLNEKTTGEGMLDLLRELPPPPGLEDRVVTALAHDGLLRALAPLRRRWWMQTAAAVLLFASGALAGVMWDGGGTPVATGQPRFLLLLEDGESGSPREEMRTVEAYRAWAAGLRDAGRLITGERLAPEAAIVPSAAMEDASPVQGYFIVSATDLADAARVAQASPHVARGGRITVRPIDTP